MENNIFLPLPGNSSITYIYIFSFEALTEKTYSMQLGGLSNTPTNSVSIVLYYIHLTNRFHVAVHLSSNRSQMTSKCGKNKKVPHEAIAECVTDVLTAF